MKGNVIMVKTSIKKICSAFIAFGAAFGVGTIAKTELAPKTIYALGYTEVYKVLSVKKNKASFSYSPGSGSWKVSSISTSNCTVKSMGDTLKKGYSFSGKMVVTGKKGKSGSATITIKKNLTVKKIHVKFTK